jgi:outer membrane protein
MDRKKATTVGVFTFLVLCLFQANSAFAHDLKIGYIESAVILDRMPEMRAVEQRLQNFANRKIEELSQLERELQQEIESYQQRVSVISDQARQREEERLGQLNFELRQKQQEAQRELEERRIELITPLLDQIQTSMRAVAQQKGIDYVLSTTTRMGDAIILYVNEDLRAEYDITDAVMRHLGI